MYYEGFQNGPAGWTALDMNEQLGTFWHQTIYDDGSEPRGVMWCGSDGFPNWVSAPGYGNRWIQFLSKSFELGAAPVSIDYVLQYDTENDWDFVYVEISTDGGATYTTLAEYHGNSLGFESVLIDLSAYADQEVTILFRFMSDGAWSDEDGYWDTDGACRLDQVQVTGYPLDDFETDNNGWIASVPDPFPVSYRIDTTPPCIETIPCPNWCFTWVGYDPETCVFPYPTEEYLKYNVNTNFGIESPVIDIPTDATAFLLEFDVYRVLPLANCVFYYWEIAAPPPEEGGQWDNFNYVYYGDMDPYLFHASFDITELIPPGTSSMKIRLSGWDGAPYWAGIHCDAEPEHNVSPMFDNVSILAYGTADPGVDCTPDPGNACEGIPSPCAQEGSVAGYVTADCPDPGTGLYGVEVDAYVVGDGNLLGSEVTDMNGFYQIDSLAAGDYTITVVTPLSYVAAQEEIPVTVVGGEVATVNFDLTCIEITPNQRSKGFWKHQVGVALGGKGNAQIDAATLCDYLDLIEAHFNSNAINQVIVYEPPASGECTDKLVVAKDLLNLKGNAGMTAKAKQQFMALLLNVASSKLGLQTSISEDGATVSQAITHCDHLIDDPAGDHEQAKDICDMINNAQTVPAGMIPLDTDNIAYSPPAKRKTELPESYALGQNHPNPFNPNTTIDYSVPVGGGNVSLKIYDVSGRLVRTLVNGHRPAGNWNATWDGKDSRGMNVATGIYFYQLKAIGFSETRKMVLMK
jgi:hypothetical protein